jgi:hypothetical protein
MVLATLLVCVLVVAVIIGSAADPPRAPAPPDRQRDYDMRRRQWR